MIPNFKISSNHDSTSYFMLSEEQRKVTDSKEVTQAYKVKWIYNKETQI